MLTTIRYVPFFRRSSYCGACTSLWRVSPDHPGPSLGLLELHACLQAQLWCSWDKKAAPHHPGNTNDSLLFHLHAPLLGRDSWHLALWFFSISPRPLWFQPVLRVKYCGQKTISYSSSDAQNQTSSLAHNGYSTSVVGNKGIPRKWTKAGVMKEGKERQAKW